MQITPTASLEEIRARMGDEATADDARRMLSALLAAGHADTDDVSDAEWLRLIDSSVRSE